jgi:transcriptional regulator with XRE-family HTH domain
MAERRLTQDRVGREVGVSQNLVSLWARGKSVPDLYQAAALARLLGTSLDYLADDARDDPPAPEPVPSDERAILNLYRALRLTEAEALRGLALAATLPLHPPLTEPIQGRDVAPTPAPPAETSRPAPRAPRGAKKTGEERS